MNELEGETAGRGQVPLFCIKYKKIELLESRY
jgi:hypothetical protein